MGPLWPAKPRPDIARLKQHGDISGLIQALQHMDWRIRRDAARALGEARAPQAVPGLTTCLLKDTYWLVRWSAATALQEIGDYRACPILALCMNRDTDRHVRLACKRAFLALEQRRG